MSKEVILARQHIARKLQQYYSQPAEKVVGSTSGTTIPFRYLLGRPHWQWIYRRLYNKQSGQWLTPVELFQPYYSFTVANYCAACCSSLPAGASFEILELGGGLGTNAKYVLDHLLASAPCVYERLNSYSVVDGSMALQETQEKLLQRTKHGDKVHFICRDLSVVVEDKSDLLSSSPNNVPTVVIALELLDNLGHDKILIDRDGQVQQANVEWRDDRHHENFVPLNDLLLRNVLQMVPSYCSMGELAWIPTVAVGLLMQICRERPCAFLMMADFDWLPSGDCAASPDTTKVAFGEPIVTDMNATDHPSYVDSPELCDILFPTHFDNLAAVVSRLWSVKTKVSKQSDFLLEYGPEQVDATRGWLTKYSPMLDDFGNCSVLCTDVRAGINQ